jgi:hypothetical protein
MSRWAGGRFGSTTLLNLENQQKQTTAEAEEEERCERNRRQEESSQRNEPAAVEGGGQEEAQSQAGDDDNVENVPGEANVGFDRRGLEVPEIELVSELGSFLVL